MPLPHIQCYFTETRNSYKNSPNPHAFLFMSFQRTLKHLHNMNPHPVFILLCVSFAPVIIAGSVQNTNGKPYQVAPNGISRESGGWASTFPTGSYSGYTNYQVPTSFEGSSGNTYNNTEVGYQTNTAASGTIESYGTYPYYTYYQDFNKENQQGYHHNHGPTYKYKYQVYPDPQFNTEVKGYGKGYTKGHDTKGWSSYEYQGLKDYGYDYDNGWDDDEGNFFC